MIKRALTPIGAVTHKDRHVVDDQLHSVAPREATRRGMGISLFAKAGFDTGINFGASHGCRRRSCQDEDAQVVRAPGQVRECCIG